VARPEGESRGDNPAREIGTMKNALLVFAAALVLSSSMGTAAIAGPPARPAVGPDRPFHPPAARRFRLPGGLSLLVVERRALPLVYLELVLPGAGAAADPPGKAGLAAFTADLVDEGSEGRSALAMARAADSLGARVETYADRRAAHVSMRVLVRTLPQGLDLLAEMITRPGFSASDVRRVHADRMTALRLRRDRPREVSALRLDAALFGPDSPQGHPVDGDLTSFARLGAADARAFHRSNWNPATATLIIVGDVDAAEMAAQVGGRLGSWKHRTPSAHSTPMPPGRRSPARLVLVDRPGAAQSDVVFGLVSIPRTDPRAYAWEVLLNAFGGGFTGRLTQILRERLGYLYHVYPELTYDPAGGSRYTVLAPLVTPRTAAGIKEILAIAEDLAAKGPPPAELEKARRNLVRDLPDLFETNRDTARAFAELVLLGMPHDWYVSYQTRILAVDAVAVRAAARTLLAGSALVFALVGDLTKIGAQLDALGFGKPEVYDLEGRRRP
jgi:zinc protease